MKKTERCVGAEHPLSISVRPDSIYQQAFPQQPWQDSDPLEGRSLTSGQRSIKGNLFSLRKAMILLSSTSHPPPLCFSLKGRRDDIHPPVTDVFGCCISLLHTDFLRCVLHWVFVTFPSDMFKTSFWFSFFFFFPPKKLS